MILCFSGTGNSRYIAEKIAAVLDDDVININDRIRNKDYSRIDVEDRLIFVTPTYGWRLPRLVADWIKRTEFNSPIKVWFVMTCGGEIGNAEQYNKQLCIEKSFDYMGTAQINMPENYVVMFTVPEQSEIDNLIELSAADIKKCTDLILDNAEFPQSKISIIDKLLSGLVNKVFYSVYVNANGFNAEDKCIKCGKCENVCPLGNIVIKDGKPSWGSDCTHCMACISICPTEAIEYGKKTKGKKRYYLTNN